jgi:hypothetical protein
MKEKFWNIYRECHQKEPPRNFYVNIWQEYVIQESQEEGGLVIKDGTSWKVEPLRMMMFISYKGTTYQYQPLLVKR